MIVKLTADMTLEEGLAVQNSNNKFLHTHYIDYPIEQGTDGVWTYRKWNSGFAECWCAASINCPFTQSWGSFYASDSPFQAIEYPFAFTSDVVCNFELSYAPVAAGYFIAANIDTRKATPKFNVYVTSKYTNNMNFTGRYYVTGRWKEE